MPKVSIIVPVYNVERYFDQCAQSLFYQTCRDIEIIFINDGSPDNCPAMCDEYEKQHPELVRVVHQKNCGQNVAWNTGLSVATGEWICFVDSDDWAEPNMIETMLKYAENKEAEANPVGAVALARPLFATQNTAADAEDIREANAKQLATQDAADIHVFGHYKEYKNKMLSRVLFEYELTHIEKSNFIYHKHKLIPTEAWGKLFRRSLIENNNLSFYPDHFHHEDVIFNLKAFNNAKKVCLHPECLYHYRMVNSGFMKRWDEKRMDIYMLYINRYFEFIDSHFKDNENRMMKHKHLLDVLIYWIAEHYGDKRSGYTKKQTAGFIKQTFENEPFKSAIENYPIRKLKCSQKISAVLLKMRLYRLWIALLNFFKKIKTFINKNNYIGFE